MAGFKKNSEAIWFADGVAFTNAVFTVLGTDLDGYMLIVSSLLDRSHWQTKAVD